MLAERPAMIRIAANAVMSRLKRRNEPDLGMVSGSVVMVYRSGFKGPFFAISQVEVVFDHHFDQPLEIDFRRPAEFIASF